MPSQLVSSSGCCQPCDSEPIVVNVPGPQGAAGTNGTNGTNGIDAFTYTTAPFFIPALGASVVVDVDNVSFLPQSVAGQFFVSVQGAGYFQVTSIDGINMTVTLQNPAAGVLGIANAIPTTLIPSGSLMTLAGAIGATGAAGVSGGAPTGASYICSVDCSVQLRHVHAQVDRQQSDRVWNYQESVQSNRFSCWIMGNTRSFVWICCCHGSICCSCYGLLQDRCDIQSSWKHWCGERHRFLAEEWVECLPNSGV